MQVPHDCRGSARRVPQRLDATFAFLLERESEFWQGICAAQMCAHLLRWCARVPPLQGAAEREDIGPVLVTEAL